MIKKTNVWLILKYLFLSKIEGEQVISLEIILLLIVVVASVAHT